VQRIIKLMETTDETSRELRRVINAIHDLSELEIQIPACRTIDEVEEIRLRCQAIQFYDREIGHVGSTLVAWAKRCATLCQLRITELQDIARRKKNGEVTGTGNFAASPAQKVRQSERRAVNGMPKEELAKQLDSGVTDIRKIAAVARKIRKKPEPKSTPKELEQARARYFRNKEKKRGPLPPPPPKLSPAQKFERYWTQEKKLLQQFFGDSDLSSIEGYWVREFQSYRKEVEDGKRERDEALAKLKNTTTAQRTDAQRE
jgi:hypothetical protein